MGDRNGDSLQVRQRYRHRISSKDASGRSGLSVRKPDLRSPVEPAKRPRLAVSERSALRRPAGPAAEDLTARLTTPP